LRFLEPISDDTVDTRLGPVMPAAESLQIVDRRRTSPRVRLHMVVFQEQPSTATRMATRRIPIVDHPLLSAGRMAPTGTGVDRPACGVLHQQRYERPRQQGSDGVVGERRAV